MQWGHEASLSPATHYLGLLAGSPLPGPQFPHLCHGVERLVTRPQWDAGL